MPLCSCFLVRHVIAVWMRRFGAADGIYLIVLRTEDCGIITQRGLCRINTGVLLILSKN